MSFDAIAVIAMQCQKLCYRVPVGFNDKTDKLSTALFSHDVFLAVFACQYTRLFQ